jgi:uncharacterized protein
MSSTVGGISIRTKAYAGPFAIFMLLLALPDLLTACGVDMAAAEDSKWWLMPQVWLYSLQTIACGAALWIWRKHYEFRPASGLLLGAACGTVGIALWIAPGWLFQSFRLSAGWWGYFGFADRSEGFDLAILKQHSNAAHFVFLAIRFSRLAIIVPLVEEIFWRGFLMRILVDPDGDYWAIPFGTHHRRSLLVVTTMFVLAHASVDYAGAAIYGLLTYWLAVKTKSLAACVVMHAVANLLLGIYILNTAQWGYW